MPIRVKNLDLNTEGMKGYEQVSLKDVTAANDIGVFVAPVDCVVDYIDLFSNKAMPTASTTASTTVVTVRVELATASDSLLVTRGTSATTTTTNSILVGERYRLTPSANNSLTAGQVLNLVVAVGGSGTISGGNIVVR